MVDNNGIGVARRFRCGAKGAAVSQAPNRPPARVPQDRPAGHLGRSTSLINSGLALAAGAFAGKLIRRSEISSSRARPATGVRPRTWPPRSLSAVRKWKCHPATFTELAAAGKRKPIRVPLHALQGVDDLLLLDHFGQRAVRRLLLGLAANFDGLEPAVDARGQDARRAVGQRVESRLQLVQRLPAGDAPSLARGKRRPRQTGSLRLGDQFGPTVGLAAIDPTVKHHHLAVGAVEGAQSEVPVAEQFTDGDVAVVAARQKAGDGGNLVHLGGASGEV